MICHIDNIPKAELKVYSLLKELGESTAPFIVINSKKTIGLASVYKLLDRLVNRGHVKRREEYFDIAGTNTKRVYYSVVDKS